jgi:hypothetical protein
VRKESTSASFEVLTAVLLKIYVFWDVVLCCWVSGAWCFEGPKVFQLHIPVVKEAIQVF